MLEENKIITLQGKRYRLIERLAEGGQGVLWKVLEEGTKAPYRVLKTVLTETQTDMGRKEEHLTDKIKTTAGQLQEEIRFLSTLKQPEQHYITACLAQGTLDSHWGALPAMVMPLYPDGLAHRLPKPAELRLKYDLPQALTWLYQLAVALVCTHRQRINSQAYLHRDIKPANLLLTEDNDIRLIDFGIVRRQSDEAGTTTVAHCTPAWSAPEQVLPKKYKKNYAAVYSLTAKTDVYQWGLLAHYMLSAGTQTQAQATLFEDSETLRNRHFMSVQTQGEGLWGECGGLSAAEKRDLKQQLLRHFFRYGETVVPTQDFALPRPQWLSERLADLLERVLQAEPKARPNATQVRDELMALQAAIAPELRVLRWQDTKVFALGEPIELKLKLEGSGLLADLSWLRWSWDNKLLPDVDVRCVEPLNGDYLPKCCQLRIRLPAFKHSGTYKLRVSALVGDEDKTAVLPLILRSKAEAYWEAGDWRAALREDCRTEWLDAIEKEELQTIADALGYVSLLQELKQTQRLQPFCQRSLFIEKVPQVVIMHPDLQQEYPFVDGWSALKMGLWQQYTAKKLGLPVFFRDKLKAGGFAPEMAVIPAGEYTMGSPEDEPERRSRERQHRVVIEALTVGRYPVTFAEYDRFCEASGREKPKDHWGRNQQLVINVNWFDAVAYCDWLSAQTGQHYRLLTEAEWEYVCRAGTTTAFYFGETLSTAQANYDGNYPYNGGKKGGYLERTTAVGTYPANALGVYDCHGNVWEWCASGYSDDYDNLENKTLKNDGENSIPAVLRGGSWYFKPGWLRSAYRGWNYRDRRFNDVGFRIARTR